MTALVPGEGNLLLVMLDVNRDFGVKSAFTKRWVAVGCRRFLSFVPNRPAGQPNNPLRNYARAVHTGSAIKNILQD